MSRTQTPPTALTPAVYLRPVAGARWAIPRRIHGARLADRLHGAVRAAHRGPTAREWALTPVPPRPIPPAGRGDRPPGVARCRARHAARRCRGPRSPCPSRRPGHARCGRRGFHRRRPGRGCAPRCVRRSPRCRLSSSSHSPVWMPARISMPNVSASARKASAQRMACVGRRTSTRWPSPVLLTTVPPNRCVRSAVISPKRCSTARHRSSPGRRRVSRRGDHVGEQHGAQGAT